MEQLITEAAALNLAQLSALKCLQQMTHALDVSKRQQSLKDSSRAALEFPSLQCFVARQTIPSSPLTLVRLLKFSAQVVIVYPYMVYVCLLYYIHAWSN